MTIICLKCGKTRAQISPLTDKTNIVTVCGGCAQIPMVEVRVNIPVYLRDEIERDRAARQLATRRLITFADVAGERLALLSFALESEKAGPQEVLKAELKP
jgi:hypothetical protein